MPFTPAHAAAALPFRRLRLPFAAIVIGSMSPDDLYFLELAPGARFGHTLAGVVLLDLPLSLLVFWLWQTFLQPSLRTFRGEQETTAPRPLSVMAWMQVAAAILLGAATHIVWDAFTHRTFWPYQHVSALHLVLSLPAVGALPVYQWLQYVSSVAGLFILALWWAIHRRANPRAHPFPLVQRSWRLRIAAAVTVSLLAGLLRAYLGTRPLHSPYPRRVFLSEWVVTAMSALLALWLGTAINLRRGKPRI